MDIIVYIIENNKKIVKYILSYNEIEMLEFINNLKNTRFEDDHVYTKSQEDNYISKTTITSTENLVTYFESTINNKLLNLEQLNHLFKEYNNPMYSPATMKSFRHFFDLLTIKDRTQMLLEDYIDYFKKKTIEEQIDTNNSKEKIEYAFQNHLALDRLGINLKKRYKNQLDEAVEKRKSID